MNTLPSVPLASVGMATSERLFNISRFQKGWGLVENPFGLLPAKFFWKCTKSFLRAPETEPICTTVAPSILHNFQNMGLMTPVTGGITGDLGPRACWRGIRRNMAAVSLRGLCRRQECCFQISEKAKSLGSNEGMTIFTRLFKNQIDLSSRMKYDC